MNEQVKKSKMNKQTNDKKAAVNQNELIKMLLSNLVVWWRNKSSIPKKRKGTYVNFVLGIIIVTIDYCYNLLK